MEYSPIGRFEMKILPYIKSLLPSFEKETIKEDIRATIDELNAYTIPVYKTASKMFNTPPTNKLSVLTEKGFKNRLDDFKGNHIQTILKAMVSLEKNLQKIDDLFDKEFKSTILKDTFTYTRVQMLQYIEVAAFLSQYARRYLLLVATLEVTQELTKAQQRDFRWIEQNKDAFIVGLHGALLTAKQVEEKLRDAPDVLVNDESVAAMNATRGRGATDGFKHGLIIGTKFNIIYHVRMAIADWQVARHNLAKEEKEALELKLFYLKQKAEGKEDARLEQQIAYLEERIEKIKFKIHKMEKDAE